MKRKVEDYFSNNFKITLSQCLLSQKTTCIYKAIDKNTNRHCIIKIFQINLQFKQIVQKTILQAKDLVFRYQKQQSDNSAFVYQYHPENNLIYICRPFLLGQSIHDIIAKNSQNSFNLQDFPYLAAKYYQLMCRTFSTNFLPTLKNVYYYRDRFQQNYTSFKEVLFLKKGYQKGYEIPKAQFVIIYPYLASNLVYEKSKDQKIEIIYENINKFLKFQCKIRSFLIYLISFMIGKSPNLIQKQELPDKIDLQSELIKSYISKIKQKWKKFLNYNQNIKIFQQYGLLFAGNKNLFINMFSQVFYQEKDFSQVQFANLKFFDFINKRKNVFNFLEEKRQSKKQKESQKKIQIALNSLKIFLINKQSLKHGDQYYEQDSKTYLQRELDLNTDLLNCFIKWYNFCQVSQEDQTEQIKENKLKIEKQLDQYIASCEFQKLQYQEILANDKRNEKKAQNIFFLKNQILNKSKMKIREDIKQNKKQQRERRKKQIKSTKLNQKKEQQISTCQSISLSFSDFCKK